MDSAQYSGGLEKAQKSLDKYIQKNVSLENVVGKAVGTIGKLAAGIGAAMGAQEAFDKVMRGSQTTSDAYDRTMRSVNTTIDSFFTAISTGDFTTFNIGLDNIIRKARAANDAIDQLGNTTISYGYFNSKNQADFAEAIAVLRDPKAGESDKEAAKKTVDRIMGSQKEITGQLRRRAEEAAKALATEKNSLKAGSITMLDVEKVLRLDVSAMGSEEKEELSNRYNEYIEKYNELKRKYTKTVTMPTTFGATSSPQTDYKALDEAMADVNNKYQDAILYNEILVRNSDEWLKNLVGILNTADNAERTFAGMQKTLNRALGSGGTSGAGGSNKKLSGVDAKEQWTGELVLNTYIQKTAETQLDDEIFKAIQGDKKLPVLMQPVQELIEGGMNEGPEEVEDPALEGLRDRIGMYDTIQQKIASYKDMLKYANEEEAGYIQSQIAMWEEYANKIGLTVKEGDDLSAITGAIGQIGGALSSTGNDWLSYIGNSMSAVVQMIQAVQALTSAKSAAAVAEQATLPFPENLVAIASTIAAITSAMSSIRSIGNFAEGGIVGGTNYQDGITARVSSGEMFINQADQKKLYDSIHSGNLGGGSGRAVITGEQIVIATNNWGKRTGRGELLFSK